MNFKLFSGRLDIELTRRDGLRLWVRNADFDGSEFHMQIARPHSAIAGCVTVGSMSGDVSGHVALWPVGLYWHAFACAAIRERRISALLNGSRGADVGRGMTACDRCGAPLPHPTPDAAGGVEGACAASGVGCGADTTTDGLPEWMEHRHGGDPIGTGLPGYSRDEDRQKERR